MSEFIPVNLPLMDGNEKKYLIECIDSGWISSEGPFVELFEQQLAERVERKYGIAVSNGSSAIDLAIEVLNISPGDEVILPTFTIISCINQIVRNGANPILVDSDPLTWSMNVNQVIDKITEKTKAILIPHIYGLPVDMDPILKIAKEKNIFVIEDAAEMHGQMYKSHPCGSFGDLSIFSFYPNKHITTGEGGMIVTNDEHLASECRSLRNLCMQPSRRFLHDRLGWNMRMTNLQAALGVAQLETLDLHVSRKREIGRKYNELLDDLNIQLPLESTAYADNIYWVYGIILKDAKNGNAATVMKKLRAKNIDTRPFFYPMHMQPVLKRKNYFKNEEYPVSENMAEMGFYLPSGLGTTDEQIFKVAVALKEVLLEL